MKWTFLNALNNEEYSVTMVEPGDPKGPFLEETLDARGSSYNGYPVSPNYVGSFCLDGLAMAMHSFYHTTSFMEAMTCCVNFLGDADSTGAAFKMLLWAICGQMAGAFYGLSAIDPRLIQRLRRWDRDEIAFRAALLFSCGQGYAIRECLKELSGGARRPTLLEGGLPKSEAKANKESGLSHDGAARATARATATGGATGACGLVTTDRADDSGLGGCNGARQRSLLPLSTMTPRLQVCRSTNWIREFMDPAIGEFPVPDFFD
eukprot:s1390_g7.t1